MTDTVKVILQDVDGAELRREKVRHKYYARCDGKQDDEQIKDGLARLGKTVICISAEQYERIFGGQDGRR